MPITDAFIATWDYSWRFDAPETPTKGVRFEAVLEPESDEFAICTPLVWRSIDVAEVERWTDE